MNMESSFRKPVALSFSGNVAENWRIFEEEFEIFVQAAHANKSGKEKAYLLLNIAGSEAIEKARSFTYSPAVADADGNETAAAESKEDVDTLKRKFKELCSPQRNTTIERYKFNSRAQRNESIQSYVAALKTLAQTCEFGELKEEMVRDRLVCGLRSDTLRKRLLKERKLTLNRATEICVIHEQTESHMTMLNAPPPGQSDASNEVNAIRYSHNNKRKPTHKPFRPSSSRHSFHNKSKGTCSNCDESHPPRQCAAYKKEM